MPLARLGLTHFSYVIPKDWFSYSGISLSLGSEEDGVSRTTLTKLHQSTMYQAKAYSVAQADHRMLRGIFSFIAALQQGINHLPIIHGAPLACWRAAKG